MRFSQAERPDKAILEAVQNLLTAFKEVDPTAKFRHLERDDRVYATREDIPPLRYMYDEMVFFNGAKPASLQPYSNPKEGRMRKVNCTIRVGSSLLMKDILDKCTWTLKDIVSGGDIFIEVKPLQHVRTETPFVLIAVPTNCSDEDLSTTLRQFIQNGVSQAKRKKPAKYKYLPDVVPTFALTTEFIKGIPYSAGEKMDKIALWMRKPWHIMIKTEDFDKFKLCIGLVERTDNFRRMCSGGAFIIEHRIHADTRPTDDEVKTLKAVLHRHIWAMKNTGQVTLQGLKKPDKESRIKRHVTDEQGARCTEDKYDIDQEMTAREIIMNIKVGDTRVFTLVALDRNGNYAAFFRNTYDDVKKLASRFEMEAAANIFWWLLRRGIENKDVTQLIATAFSEEDCLAALNTRYVEGRVVSQKLIDTELRISTFDKLNPEANITLAMSEAVKEAHQQKVAMKVALKQATFQGKSILSLGSGQQHDGWEGTQSIGTTALPAQLQVQLICPQHQLPLQVPPLPAQPASPTTADATASPIESPITPAPTASPITTSLTASPIESSTTLAPTASQTTANLPAASSRYLLEKDINSEEQLFSAISYWVLVMKAAQKQAIKLQRTKADKRRKDLFGRSWIQANSTDKSNHLGKREFSHMVAPPPGRSINPKSISDMGQGSTPHRKVKFQGDPSQLLVQLILPQHPNPLQAPPSPAQLQVQLILPQQW